MVSGYWLITEWAREVERYNDLAVCVEKVAIPTAIVVPTYVSLVEMPIWRNSCGNVVESWTVDAIEMDNSFARFEQGYPQRLALTTAGSWRLPQGHVTGARTVLASTSVTRE